MKNLTKILGGFIVLSFIYFLLTGLNSEPTIQSVAHNPSTGPLPKNFLNIIYNFNYGNIQTNISKYKDDLKFNPIHNFTNDNSSTNLLPLFLL